MGEKKENLVNYFIKAKEYLASEHSHLFSSTINNLKKIEPYLDYLDQFVYIIDIKNNQFVFVSENSSSILGHSSTYLMKIQPLLFMQTLYHPKDLELVLEKVFNDGLSATKSIKDYDMTRQRISYNVRILQQDGSYKMILNNFYNVVEDEQKNPLVIMGTSSDISEILSKKELFCKIYRLTAEGNWAKVYERYYTTETSQESDFGLSEKEKEIIKFIHKGCSTKQIAQKTARSEETIKAQRKRILSKTNSKNMTEVILLAIQNGWV